jgi:hypothetical protein
MSSLIQTGIVVKMIIDKEGRSEGYARQIIFRAVRNGSLKVYKKQLKFGTRLINLFEPDTVSQWLDTRKQYKSKKVDV